MDQTTAPTSMAIYDKWPIGSLVTYHGIAARVPFKLTAVRETSSGQIILCGKTTAARYAYPRGMLVEFSATFCYRRVR